MSAIWLGLVAAALALESGDFTVEMSLTQAQAGGPRLRVQLEYPEGSQVDLSPPVAQGLEFNRVEPVYRETVDARVFEVQEYRYSGAAGAYEVLPLSLDWENGGVRGSASSFSLFIDHQVQSQPPGEVVDIFEPDISAGTPWFSLLMGAGLLSLMGLGVYSAFRGRSEDGELKPEEVVPPHEVALTRWQAVLNDESISVDDKAVELSALFREYLEAQLHFPASAWTTTESMEHLANLVHIDEKDLKGAKRILRATDWVKYAELSTHDEALRALDSDLRGFIEATKPHVWEAQP